MFPHSYAPSGLRISLYVASGLMSEEKCSQLAEWIEHLAVSGWNRWVLDLASVEHVDYRGLQRLEDTARRLERTGGAFCWCGLSGYLRDIARVAGAYDRPAYRNRRDAVLGLEAFAAA